MSRIDFIDELTWRSLLKECTDEQGLREHLSPTRANGLAAMVIEGSLQPSVRRNATSSPCASTTATAAPSPSAWTASSSARLEPNRWITAGELLSGVALD